MILGLVNSFKFNNLNRIKFKYNNNLKCSLNTNIDNSYDPNDFINKKMISISPAGLRGFYSLGVCKFIKDNYDLSDFVFTGASAGAWNSLYLSAKVDSAKFINSLFNIDYSNATSILEIEYLIKNKFLEDYNDDDFNLDKIYLGVTTLMNFRPKTYVYGEFDSLCDAIDCCIASSHIPFVTGGLFNKYKNRITFDGGFSKNPYLDILKPVLHITPGIWTNKTVEDCTDISLNVAMNIMDKDLDFLKLYKQGYQDSLDNKKKLDSIFL